MIQISDTERRRAFSVWLRTGRWPIVTIANDVEVKFNPWHDPYNGRFTFAPGGVSSSASRRFARSGLGMRELPDAARGTDNKAPAVGNSVLEPKANQARPPARPGSAMGRGSNSRAFDDPITLEQSFPGLRNAPVRTIVAAADNLFDLTGPANRSQMDFLQDQSRQLTAQIKGLDPKWHYDEIGPTDALGTPIVTVQGLSAKVNDLRFQRAALVARVKGDYSPLQVETLRFVQQRADDAYDRGQELLKSGRLKPRLHDREALGNYVDQQVRKGLRERYNQLGIDSAGPGPVRVNRRENDSSDLTYRRPDARVKDVAFDVTLARKTHGTAQVRGFFNTDFRPSQLGNNHTYVLTRPETK